MKKPTTPQQFTNVPIQIDMTADLHAFIKEMFEEKLLSVETEEKEHRRMKRNALADMTDLKWKKLCQRYGAFMNQTSWKPTNKGERL